MITSQSIEQIIATTVLLIAYVIAGTIAGFSQAFMAHYCGDDTAEQEGFLTLNPLAHIDLIGMMFLLIVGIGWTKHVPINPSNVTTRLKLIVVSCSNVIMYIIQALVALITLEITFGPQLAHNILLGLFSVSKFLAVYPNISSTVLLPGLLCAGIIYISIVLAVLDFIITIINLGVRFYAPHLLYDRLIMFLLTLLALYVLAGNLQHMVFTFVSIVAKMITHLFGI
jgi:hypothetical protein